MRLAPSSDRPLLWSETSASSNPAFLCESGYPVQPASENICSPDQSTVSWLIVLEMALEITRRTRGLRVVDPVPKEHWRGSHHTAHQHLSSHADGSSVEPHFTPASIFQLNHSSGAPEVSGSLKTKRAPCIRGRPFFPVARRRRAAENTIAAQTRQNPAAQPLHRTQEPNIPVLAIRTQRCPTLPEILCAVFSQSLNLLCTNFLSGLRARQPAHIHGQRPAGVRLQRTIPT